MSVAGEEKDGDQRCLRSKDQYGLQYRSPEIGIEPATLYQWCFFPQGCFSACHAMRTADPAPRGWSVFGANGKKQRR